MSDITMTPVELQRLRDELGELESAGRAQIAARIRTAREWGDLKENGEYHAAKEAQAHLETRILRLREQLRSARVVQSSSDTEAVHHGSVVEVTDLATEDRRSFTIVSPNEARPGDGKLSASSPIAQALLGGKVGATVQVKTPAGTRKLRIDAIA